MLMTRLLLALALTTTAVTGCGKKDGDSAAKKDDVAWPAKPTDDTPIVWQFEKLEGTGDQAAAKMRVFNFTDKAVKGVRMTLHYIDGAGKELKTFPWGAMAPELVGAKGTKVHEVGAFIPPETKTVTATVREVEFADGTKWTTKATE